ncbi:polyketide synthase [Stemphylium lycopersici]|uniref:Polyketide synthase n=1 Tax=Stemphylium lycopersici TaxID=183478 RepID=A0A364MSM1_STELY|nr:polyketide synthase [Stemphylium lycopersici]RAQ99029.1 polyketide synthase [Stemphylium lycopersici]RAR02200.1 polyketide synthase [Stemphylium lycopersici]
MAPENQTSNTGAPASYQPVAIIGLSCRLPGDARNAEQFWELLESARGAWSEIPKSRFNLDAFYHPDHTHRGTTHVKGGHFLSQDILDFDNSFFRLNAEVAAVRPLQAGLCMEDLAGSRTSVFAGAFHRDHHDSMMKDPDNLPRNTMLGAGTAMLANRISHYFDLRGPSLVADTGCSTSHVILHMACQSLQTGDSTISVVTAGNVMLGPEPFISMSGLGLLSKDGRCYAFDSRASGYGRGEGAVSLVLKLESQAIADGDNIHAVIRSTALNQDGRTPTITSPSQEAQEELIRECYQKAGLDPAETDYFECHGTGTQVGDLTEATAVRNVFRASKSSSSGDHPLYVGSVKSNIGHLEAAAGLAGIVKVVQAMRHGKIPPNHDFQRPNPKIPLAEWGLTVSHNSLF